MMIMIIFFLGLVEAILNLIVTSGEKITLISSISFVGGEERKRKTRKDNSYRKTRVESTMLTVEMQQYGNPFLGSNNVQLSCIVGAEEDDIVDRIIFLSRLGGLDYKSIILFSIKDNLTAIINPNGHYLEGRVTLKNLLSSENRTVVEYNKITCDDNAAYRCDVQLSNYNTEISKEHSIKVKGIPNKPDGIPIRTPDSNLCQGINVNYSCSGLVGAPPGYFKWTKLSSGSTTIYNETFNSDIPGECNINRTSILSIEVQKEDNNASFRCQVIHEQATSEMYQQTLPEMFVYDPYEYTVITKRPDKIYYDLTTPYIELTCFAQGCTLPNYTWYKDIDLNTSIGNESLYVISDVEIESSGSYICVIETIVNGTEEKYNQTVTIDIRIDHSKDISVDKTFAESTAGIVTITVLSTVGVVIASVVLFKTIKKARHLQTLKTDGEKDTDVNHVEQEKESTNDHIYTGLQY